MSTRRRKRVVNKPSPLEWNMRSMSTEETEIGSTISSETTASPTSTTTGPITSPSSRSTSPCVSPSRKGLAYLASRRSSRDSYATTSTTGPEQTSPMASPGAGPKMRPRRTSNFLELPVTEYHIRPRVCSLPEGGYNPRSTGSPGVDELYRLRTFSITNKGLVNNGDSIVPRRSRSNISMASIASSISSIESGDQSEADKLMRYRIVLLGMSGVGKSALVRQFMTSEYINTYDVSLDDEFGERTISVMLEGKQSELVFIDHPSSEMSVENCLSTYEPHGCIIVYSVTDRSSFRAASDILRYLWQENITQERTVILVANKCDLARARIITSQEGKSLACAHDCKFIETSSGIQHNVDELLVGVLKQCRLWNEKSRKDNKAKEKNKLHGSRTSISLHMAKEILDKLCFQNSKSKSCENLFVL